MRLLSWIALAIVIPAFAAGPALGQKRPIPRSKPDPVKLDDTIAWLNGSIAKDAGFSLAKPLEPGVQQPVQEKLLYEINSADSCHLNWRSVATGDEDVRGLYPGLEQDEDLAAIAPGSIQAQPIDLQDLLIGGTGDPEQSATDTAASKLYWKVIAVYADATHEQSEPFGFLFADMQMAQHVAAVLEHGVSLCRATHTPERETNVGCDASPTLKVINTAKKSKVSNLGAQGVAFIQGGDMIYFAGHYVNQSDQAVSCVADFTFHTRSTLPKSPFDIPQKSRARDSLVTFDLAPGQAADASLGMPHDLGESLGSIHYLCYPKGAVNVLQNSCAELNHPLHWDAKKPRSMARP